VNANATVAEFLRSARERLSPADAGLAQPALRARRVKGLRRDEVARLAGISSEYYTRIEQGRVPRASDAVINGLAEALRLTETERGYLFELLGASTRGRTPQRKRNRKVRAPLRQLLDRLDSSPAFVLGVGMEVLAMNELAKLFIHDFTTEKGTARSLARWAFLAPEARSFYLEWEDVAADIVAILRHDASSHRNDRELNELIGELTVKSSDFREWWAQHKVYECTSGRKRLNHPVVGRVDIDYQTFPVPGEPDQHLFVYNAQTGSPSDDALRILASLGNDITADKPSAGQPGSRAV
jgi:transcriptional regulator with XRE-family HTH domain